MLPDKWHNLLHRLWSKATSHPDYVKAEWVELEGILVRCAAKRDEDGADSSAETAKRNASGSE